MRWFHLVFGLALFVVFTTTGSYMRADFPDKDSMDQTLRVLTRSRHIYILYSSLVHMSLGLYLVLRPRLWQKLFQIVGSITLLISSVLLVWAWYVETYQTLHFTDISREGIYLSLAAVVLHAIGGVKTESAA